MRKDDKNPPQDDQRRPDPPQGEPEGNVSPTDSTIQADVGQRITAKDTVQPFESNVRRELAGQQGQQPQRVAASPQAATPSPLTADENTCNDDEVPFVTANPAVSTTTAPRTLAASLCQPRTERGLWMWRCILVSVILVTLAVVVVVAVVVTQNRNDSDASVTGARSPTVAPTRLDPVPTLLPSQPPSLRPSIHPSAPSTTQFPSFEPTSAPTSEPIFQAFTTTQDLYDAVDAYLEDNSNSTLIAATYGHPIGSWNVSLLTDLGWVFNSFACCGHANPLAASFNEDIGNWDVSRATAMFCTFCGASSFNQDLSRWNVQSVRDFEDVFSSATSFRQNLCSWGPAALRNDAYVGGMFRETSCPNTSDPDLTLTPPGPFCFDCTGFRSFETTQELYDAVDDYLDGTFDDDRENTTVALTYGFPIGTWNVSALEDFSFVFNTLSTSGAPHVARRGAPSFDESLAEWDMSRATNLESMFSGARSFQGNGLADWNVGHVTSFRSTFAGATSFREDLSAWNVNNEATDFQAMFFFAEAFEGIGLSQWNVTKGVSFGQMFDGALFFRNDLCAWGSIIQEDALVDDMFRNSGCPNDSSPSLMAIPPGPFCFECS